MMVGLLFLLLMSACALVTLTFSPKKQVTFFNRKWPKSGERIHKDR